MLTDKDLETLRWKQADGMQLNELLADRIICGAEPIDYPKTDGVFLFLKDRSGKLSVIEIGQDPDAECFDLLHAELPPGMKFS